MKESKAASDKDAILAVLTEDGQSSEVIAQAAKLPSGTARKRLDSMLKDATVSRSGSGKKNDAFLWSKMIPQENHPYSAETHPGLTEAMIHKYKTMILEAGSKPTSQVITPEYSTIAEVAALL